LSASVGFVGLSHLGIVSSAAWASTGMSVVAVDPDADLVARLERRELPIHEPGLVELIASAGAKLRYSARLEDLTGCSLVVVSRDVPTDDHGKSDARALSDLVRAAIPQLAPNVVLVVMSQVPPGYTRELGALIARERPELGVRLVYLVETLIFGAAVQRATRPERSIVGLADPAQPLPPELADVLQRFGSPILPMSYESAELAKTAINLYLIGSVTYANTMADLCEAVGADWSQIVPALRLDARIGQAAYLRPGLGISGNLERDLETLRALGAARGVDLTLFDALAAHNDRRSGWALRKARQLLEGAGPDSVVALWGLAYKKDTRSLKNAPSLELIQGLSGRARVRAWDPMVTAADLAGELGKGHEVTIASSAEDATAGADCLFVMTDWDELRRVDLAAVRTRMRQPVIVDCVGIVDPGLAARSGLDLRRMGRA
jgi:UDPglucose 6-dehydrogenase